MSFEQEAVDLGIDYGVTLYGYESEEGYRYQIFISGSPHFPNDGRLSSGSRAQDVLDYARERLLTAGHKLLPRVPKNPDGDALDRLVQR